MDDPAELNPPGSAGVSESSPVVTFAIVENPRGIAGGRYGGGEGDVLQSGAGKFDERVSRIVVL